MAAARVLVSNVMMLNERARFDRAIRAMGCDPVWAPDLADYRQFLDERQCLELVEGIDGWLAGDDQITRSVLEKAIPRLKVIAKWGTGLDSIDSAVAAELGVQVFNAPGAFADAVGEVAIGLMLMLTRHLGAIDRSIRAGGWPKPQGVELRGSTLGIVGFGAIGSRIGQFASAFGMDVIYSDPIKSGSIAPDDLASKVDILCLACALTPENRHMVDEKFLGRMKSSAFLVNVARGGLIDEAALIGALKRGDLAGAALDVFEEEPLSFENPLRQMENVVLSSHNANNGWRAVEHVHQTTLDNLARGLNLSTIGK